MISIKTLGHLFIIAACAMAFSPTAYAAVNCTGTATNKTCTNTDGTITFPSTLSRPPSSNVASPSPSLNPVSGMNGTISTITVTLTNLNHSAPQDIGLMLVAPDGTTNLVIMSNGGGVDVNNNAVSRTYTIVDGNTLFPYNVFPPSASGTYGPTSQDPDGIKNTNPQSAPDFDVVFPAGPTPKFSGPRNPLTPTLNGTFGGLDPNGTWKLYAVQSIPADNGLTLQNWSITITTASLTSTTTALSTNVNPVFTVVPSASALLTATVTSGGNSVGANGTVTFKDGNATICNNVAVSAQGTAQCTYTSTVEGSHVLSAIYSGTATLASSNANLTEQVDRHTTNPSTGKFCNVGSISVPGSGVANVYPSHIYLPSMPGTVASIGLQLSGVTTTDLSTLAALLVSPDGAVFVPIREVGQLAAASNISFTLQDGSPAAQTTGALISGNTYGPAAYSFTATFAPPAPVLTTANYAAPLGTATFTSAFGGAIPNGSGANAGSPWTLYLTNGTQGTAATIAGGWCLNVTTNPPVLTVTKTHTGPGAGNAFVVNQTGTYKITVGNSGPGTTAGAQVNVSDTLPTGFTQSNISAGAEWNCTASTSTAITCITGNTVNSGVNYSDIVVTVTPDNTAGTTNVQNTATASGTGLTTGSGKDTSTVLHAPTLGVTVTDSGAGTFTQGDTNRTFTITVSNTAGAPTSGTVTLTLALSDGTALIPQSVTPNGWTCQPVSGLFNCTNSSAVSAGNSFPAVTLTVNVAAGAPSPQILTASVSGGGGNSPTSSDSVTIIKTQTITFAQPADHVLSDSPVTLTASASSGLPVAFTSNSVAVCTTTTAGVVTLVSPGACSITVTQAGNSVYVAAPPVTQTFQVNKNPQTITFGPLTDRAFGSAAFTPTATASSGLAVAFSSTNPAICSVSSNLVTLVAVGQCTIRASQSGNATYAVATPVDQSFNITQASQTITFGPLSNVAFGAAVPPLSASVPSGLAVAFSSTTLAVCTVSGTTVTTIAVGQCTIQADQAGNTNYAAASPVTQSFQVTQATQNINFQPFTAKAFGDPAFTANATASSNLPVSFASTTPAVCSVSANTVTILSVGQCTVQATQAGNTNYQAAAPASQSVNITQGSQTITFGSLGNQVFGAAPFNISATASSGLPVSFASTTQAVCTVSGNTVTIVAVGQCSIQATQAGNTNYFPATPVTQSFQVTQANQTITFNPLTDVAFGSGPITLSATASSNLTVSFASNTPAVCTVLGTTVTLVSVGQCSITASQSGNTNYSAATSVTRIFNVTQATQTITFGPLGNKTFGDPAFGVSATASSGLTVTFSSTTPGVCTVIASTVTITGAGQCTIRASQAGNTNYASATPVDQSFTVNQASQTITFGPLADQPFGTPPFALSATVNSGLTLAFNSQTPAVCTVLGNTVTLVSGGQCTIQATQAGNTNYAAATPVSQSFTVTQAPQTITFGPLVNQVFGVSPFGISATATSGLTVSFSSLTPTVCTVSGSTVTILAAGGCNIQATQAGNANFVAATPVTRGFTVTQAPQSITFSPLVNQVFGAAPFAISATATSGLPVSFSSLTPAVCSVSSSTVTILATGGCTIQATQAGNTNFAAATPVSQGFTVTQAPQTITFGTLPDKVLGNAPFPLTATASSGLAVTYSSLTPGVCTVDVAGTAVTLANLGTCTIHAIQIGSSNYLPATPVDRSLQVLLTPPGGQPYISGQTTGAIRSNFSGFVGMQFTVGASAINITSLGRIYLSGNSQTHTVKLVNASTGADVTGGSVQLTMTPGTPNTYEYAVLASPVQLLANTTYYLLSQETAGGDTWYDYTPVTHSNVAAINGPIYQSGPSSYAQVPGSPNYSFVPANFLYNVASVSPPPAVTITAPTQAATVSGNSVLITATATAAPSLSITGVQFKVDTNTLIGTPVLTPPYQIAWDTTTLSDGVHTLTAVATDNIGGSTTSAPVDVNVSNGQIQPTGSEFVTGAQFGSLRNNYDGFVGMQFTVGAQNLTVNALGRVYVAGNSRTHTIKLVNAANGLDVPGGSVTLNMTGGTAFRFKYAALASPLILPAGTSYYLVSSETSNGDQWYDYGPVTITNVAAVNGAVYLSGANYFLVPSSQNEAFVPVNFLYNVSVPVNTPPTVTVTAPAAGPAAGTISFNATATANGGLNMKSLQLKLDGNNFGSPTLTVGATQQVNASLDTTTLTNGSHTLTAIGIDSANNMAVSPPVVINVNNVTPPPSPAFITGQTFGTARNNFSGSVGMKFTTGATTLNVTQLGRICIAGNNQSHTVKLVLASTSADVPGGSIAINMAGCTAGQYKYASLGSPVSLAANTSYELVSQETNGGDQWYDYAPVSAAAGAGTVNGPVYSSGATYTLVPSPGYSYVPVNFQYNVSNNPPPSVSITAPLANAGVSGNLTITANATAANGLTIQSVQFKQNGVNIGAPVTGSGPNYSVQLDTTALVNGATYNLTAVATDSANNTATSATVPVTVNNNAPPAGSPLITGQTFGTPRNNFGGFVGMQFTTTGTPVVANSLGRICVAGNTGSHLLKLVKYDGTDLPGGSATVNMAGCTPGQYKYATLAIPLQLSANTTYYLMSQEVAGGDQWYDYAPVTPAAGVASVNGPVYFAAGYQLVPSPGYSYVPVNMLYQ